jgi:hypothetical protein
VTGRDLSWELIRTLRSDFAPTSSLLAAAKAVLHYWPRPSFLLQAAMRGRLARPGTDVALRIDVLGLSPSAARSGVQFFKNMRVPPSSPIAQTFNCGRDITDMESLGRWVTSNGDGLPDRRALTCGAQLGPVTYGFISLL